MAQDSSQNEEKKSSSSWLSNSSLATVYFEQLVTPPCEPSNIDVNAHRDDSIKLVIESKIFRDQGLTRTVLKNLSLTILPGEFLCMNGPNGCGKTTLLKIIAGLDRDFSGETNQVNLNAGFVFQNYKESLFPWMNNLDNISYSSLLEGTSKKGRAETVQSFLTKYALTVDLSAYPYQQSGGQQQVVSILRAMIYGPSLLIMDEPFSSLDQGMRLKMSEVLQQYWAESGSTLIFVSHDLDESLLLADRLIVLRKLTRERMSSLLASVRVNFPRPRKAKLIESIDFFNVKSEILTLIRKDIENG
jgi:NitT/TauT family transport system ATP-binding protein